MTNLSKKTTIIDISVIIAGCIIASSGVNIFLTDAKLLSGGATGIGLIFQYLFGINAGIIVLIINIPLFLLSYLKLDKRFTIYSIIGTLALSFSLMLTANIHINLNISDPLVLCIYGGVLCGIGYGLVFSRSGSTGGTDIITMAIKKKYSNLNIGKVGLALNFIIVTVASFYFGLSIALYTLICMFTQGIVIDKVINGLNSKKLLLIITQKEQEVIDHIIVKMNRGVTSLEANGEYSHKHGKMLYCLVTTRQMISLKTTILEIDPTAFITIISVNEVKGRGFESMVA
ncbi:YitT family protein [uncultured Clostridium sp.]|uniref:YitT family protein n=1 Tax=uncultured Clostridium sp. TaxID=59620 RepID=UPI00260B1986|nr:YitT family protein [uncultured Clostridium sp.]